MNGKAHALLQKESGKETAVCTTSWSWSGNKFSSIWNPVYVRNSSKIAF